MDVCGQKEIQWRYSCGTFQKKPACEIYCVQDGTKDVAIILMQTEMCSWESIKELCNVKKNCIAMIYWGRVPVVWVNRMMLMLHTLFYRAS